MSLKAIHDDFIKNLRDASSSYSTLKKLAAEFRRERANIEVYDWSVRPKRASTDENVELVHSLIMCDRRKKRLRDIAR